MDASIFHQGPRWPRARSTLRRPHRRGAPSGEGRGLPGRSPAGRKGTLARRRAVTAWSDLGHGNFRLHFVRNKDGQEVDFLMVRDGKPFLLVEAKLAQSHPARSLLEFQRALRVPGLQLTREGKAAGSSIRKPVARWWPPPASGCRACRSRRQRWNGLGSRRQRLAIVSRAGSRRSAPRTTARPSDTGSPGGTVSRGSTS